MRLHTPPYAILRVLGAAIDNVEVGESVSPEYGVKTFEVNSLGDFTSVYAAESGWYKVVSGEDECGWMLLSTDAQKKKIDMLMFSSMTLGDDKEFDGTSSKSYYIYHRYLTIRNLQSGETIGQFSDWKNVLGDIDGTKVVELISDKVDKKDVYTKDEIDAKLNGSTGGIQSVTKEMVTSALGYTPIKQSDITSGLINSAIGYTPLQASDITSTVITDALGYNPVHQVDVVSGLSKLVGVASVGEKTGTLTINVDNSPTLKSNNLITSGAVYEAIAGIGESGGGAVTSVNGSIGAVTITASTINDRESSDTKKGYKVLSSGSIADQATDENTIYEIRESFDLGGSIMEVPEGSILRFVGGTISNGTINGNRSKIEVIGEYEALNNVLLKGSWKGNIRDSIFAYDSEIMQNFKPILQSLVLFDKATLTRNEYFITWDNSNSSIAGACIVVPNKKYFELDGQNARIYLSTNKGSKNDGWGGHYQYAVSWLIESLADSSVLRNIIIEDNVGKIKYYGYGNDPNDPTLYSMLMVYGKTSVEIDNVSYDGAGQLLKISEENDTFDYVKVNNCHIRGGNQFAIEAQFFGECIGSDGDVAYRGKKGYCKRFEITNTDIYINNGQYVGAISIPCGSTTDEVVIRNCKIDDSGNGSGNLELGAKKVYITDCEFVDEFITSNNLGEHNIEYLEVSNCKFTLTSLSRAIGQHRAWSNGTTIFRRNEVHTRPKIAMNFNKCKEIYFSDNTFYCEGDESDIEYGWANVVSMNGFTSTINGVEYKDYAGIGYFSNNKFINNGYSKSGADSSTNVYKPYFHYPWVMGFWEGVKDKFGNDYIPTGYWGHVLDDGGYYPDRGYVDYDREDLSISPYEPQNDTYTIGIKGKYVGGDLNPSEGQHDDWITWSEKNIHFKLQVRHNKPCCVTYCDNNNDEWKDITAVTHSPNWEAVFDITVTYINGYLQVFVWNSGALIGKQDFKNIIGGVSKAPTLTYAKRTLFTDQQVRYIPGGIVIKS